MFGGYARTDCKILHWLLCLQMKTIPIRRSNFLPLIILTDIEDGEVPRQDDDERLLRIAPERLVGPVLVRHARALDSSVQHRLIILQVLCVLVLGIPEYIGHNHKTNTRVTNPYSLPRAPAGCPPRPRSERQAPGRRR